MSFIPFIGRLFSFLTRRKEGESEIERKIREALKERSKLQIKEKGARAGAAVAAAAAAAAGEDAGAGDGVLASPKTPTSSQGLHRAHTRSHVGSLNAMALKFPKADAAFGQIRQRFDHYDKDKSQSIDMEELKECLNELQVSLTETEIRQLFEEADMDSSNGVQFKEFILLMALVHLLRPSDTEGGARFGLPEVEAAFDMVEDAFLFFDHDRDGYLSKDEVRHALTSGKEGIAGAAATQRFAEMDYNTDGLCSFKEFLYAYVGWVGTAEDEEEDNEDSEDNTNMKGEVTKASEGADSEDAQG